MKKLGLFLWIFTILSSSAFAQRTIEKYSRPADIEQDTVVKSMSKPFDFHLSLGTSVFADKYAVSSIFWIAPELSYRVSKKVKINAGFTYGADLLGKAQQFPTNQTVNLAPFDKPNNTFYSVYGQVEYMPNNKLWLSASIFYENGIPPFFQGYLSPINSESYGFSAAMEYRITENSVLGISISVIQSRIEGLGYPMPYLQRNQRGIDRYLEQPFNMNSRFF